MSDIQELGGTVVGSLIMIALTLAVVSLPFAFFGWILLAFLNIFGTGITYGYGTCVLAGLGVGLISSILK